MMGCAANKGQPLVMVCTDVESSTELWEWNNAVMMESLAIHDRLIRADLSRQAQSACGGVPCLCTVYLAPRGRRHQRLKRLLFLAHL